MPSRRGSQEVQDTGLLNRRGVHAPPRVRIPPSPPRCLSFAEPLRFAVPEAQQSRVVLGSPRLAEGKSRNVIRAPSNFDGPASAKRKRNASRRDAHAPVAQWIRALASGAKGHRFESCRAYQLQPYRELPHEGSRYGDVRRSRGGTGRRSVPFCYPRNG